MLFKLYFDLETTGLSRDADIVQIGAEMEGSDEGFGTLVRPTKPMDAKASEVTGIRDADLVDAPTLKDAMRKFGAWIDATKRAIAAAPAAPASPASPASPAEETAAPASPAEETAASPAEETAAPPAEETAAPPAAPAEETAALPATAGETVLIAYNGTHFDFPILILNLRRAGMDAGKFMSDHGVRYVCDPLQWAREHIDRTRLLADKRGNPSFRLNKVHQALFQEDIENAHDASADTRAMRRICNAPCFRDMPWRQKCIDACVQTCIRQQEDRELAHKRRVLKRSTPTSLLQFMRSPATKRPKIAEKE